MINTITIFESEEDLEKLTGLTHKELLDNGFTLDDMDCGFCYNVKDIPIADVKEKEHSLSNECKWNWNSWEFINHKYEFPTYLLRILCDWESYCNGYKLVKHRDRVYVILYHA